MSQERILPRDRIDSLVIALQQKMNERLDPGDPRRMNLEVIGSVLASVDGIIEAESKKKYAKYLSDDELDEYGENRGVYRLLAKNARVLGRFTLPSIRNVESIIPKGTRCTADGKVFFETTSDLIIAKGSTFIDCVLICMVPGQVGNEYATSRINTITDSLAFAVTFQNTETSYNGLEKESDARYLERIRLSKFISAVGSEEAYRYRALSVNPSIIDVKPVLSGTSTVNIVILMSGGRSPNNTEISEILTALTQKDAKLLNDLITVGAPKLKNYSVNATYYIHSSNLANESIIKNNIMTAAESFKLWQKSVLGRSINPDMLRSMLMTEGAFKVDISSPSYITLSADEIANLTSFTLSYGGLIT